MKTVFFGSDNYGAHDVTIALSRLLTAGVCMTKFDGGLIPIEEATSGGTVNSENSINENACKIISLSHDRYKVSNGTCIMPSGTVVIFRDYLFYLHWLYPVYVYLSQDINGGPVSFNVTDKAPQKADVTLARIESNVIYDMRNPSYSHLQMPPWTQITSEKTLDFNLSKEEINYIDLTYINFSYCIMLNQRPIAGGTGELIQPQRLDYNWALIGYRNKLAYYARREGKRIYIKTKFSGLNTEIGGSSTGTCIFRVF